MGSETVSLSSDLVVLLRGSSVSGAYMNQSDVARTAVRQFFREHPERAEEAIEQLEVKGEVTEEYAETLRERFC